MQARTTVFLAIALLILGFSTVKAAHAAKISDAPAYALRQMEKGDYKNAVQFLSNEIRHNPSDMQLRKLIATAFLKMGLSVKAAEQLQYICASKNAVAQDFVALGDAYRFSGNQRKAIDTYTKACQLQPDSAKAYAGLIDATFLAGDTGTARRIYRLALSLVHDAAGKQDLVNTMQKVENNQRIVASSETQFKG